MKLRPLNRGIRAFSIVDLLIIVVVVVVLVLLLLPAILTGGGSRKTKRAACMSNLKQVGLGLRIWANDHGDAFPMQVSTNQGGSKEYVASGELFHHFRTVSNQFVTPKILVCPADPKRKPAPGFATLQSQHLSYFLGIEASETNGAMLLSGDRNLSVNGVPARSGWLELTTNHVVGWTNKPHGSGGNVLRADGSVQAFGSAALQKFVRDSGVATNRLIIP